MIKVVMGNASNATNTLLLGLSRANTERLHDDQPILVELGPLTLDGTVITQVVLVAGDTEESIEAQMRSEAPQLFAPGVFAPEPCEGGCDNG